MKIISEDQGFKIELIIPNSLKGEGVSDKDANVLANIVYKPFVDRLTAFIACAIGSQDLDAIDEVNRLIMNIAKHRLRREKENIL